MQAQTYMYAFLGSRPIGPLATFKNHMKILGPLPKPTGKLWVCLPNPHEELWPQNPTTGLGPHPSKENPCPPLT